jgi:hypothetical protein
MYSENCRLVSSRTLRVAHAAKTRTMVGFVAFREGTT